MVMVLFCLRMILQPIRTALKQLLLHRTENDISPETILSMALTFPWHSTRPGETVYHNNNACTEGNNIELYYFAAGDGGLKLCHHCAMLNSGSNSLRSLRDVLSGKR